MNSFQVLSARRIWLATKKQMLIEQDIALLEHRLKSTQAYSSSELIHRMLDNIDLTLQEQTVTVSTCENDHSTENGIERLQNLKNDIIHQAIVTSRKLAHELNKDIQTEERKFSVKNRYIESTSEWQQMVLNIIELRRNYMIDRANYIMKHTLVP